MKILGLNILKGQLRYAVLAGTRKNPSLLENGKLSPIRTEDVGELMNWFETNLEALVSRNNPDKVAFRLLLKAPKEQLIYVVFPSGIIHLVCYRHGISANGFSEQSFQPSKLGLTEGTDIYNYCDTVFGNDLPNWDVFQKNAVLAAWFSLDK